MDTSKSSCGLARDLEANHINQLAGMCSFMCSYFFSRRVKEKKDHVAADVCSKKRRGLHSDVVPYKARL